MKQKSPSPEAFTEKPAELSDVLAQKKDLLDAIRKQANVQVDARTGKTVTEITNDPASTDPKELARQTLRLDLPTLAA
jgi:translation initiation factor 1 (eIF-1/SUI1)